MPPLSIARALIYRADLAVRLDRPAVARASLDAVATLALDEVARAEVRPELEHVEALLADLG